MLTPAEKSQVECIARDLLFVLPFDGWVKLHADVMAGKYGFDSWEPAPGQRLAEWDGQS